MQRTETSGRVDISHVLSNDKESIHQLPNYIQAGSAGNIGQRVHQLQYDRFVQTLIYNKETKTVGFTIKTNVPRAA